MSDDVKNTTKTDRAGYELGTDRGSHSNRRPYPRKSWMSLRFADQTLEHRFLNQYWDEALPFARHCVISSTVLWLSFGLLDAIVGGIAYHNLTIIRFGVGLPISLVLLALMYVPAVRQKLHIVLLSLIFTAGGCIIAMIAVLESPASEYYYVGVILVLTGNYALAQLRFVHATLGGLGLSFGYVLVVLLTKVPSPEVLINNTFFFLGANYVGMFACHALERYRRQNFFQQFKLGELTRQLEEISVHDPLTGLHNRRQLSVHLHDVVDQHRRVRTPASIMLIDLDDFKGINDRFGHLAGDEILKRTARLILDFLRKTDRAYRYGGDEFLVLLPNTSLSEAKTLADRLVGGLGGHNHETARFATVCGISVGVASLNVSTRDADDFLIAADRALYAAKQQGKGCVVAVGGTS